MNNAASRNAGLAGAGDDLGGDAGQLAKQRLVATERQRHQCGARLDELEAEPPGES